jgi:hypothetical protein
MEQIYELSTPTIFGATYKLSTLAAPTFVFFFIIDTLHVGMD